MKTLEELIKDLDKEMAPENKLATPDELKMLNAKIRYLKDMMEALVDLGTLTGMWDHTSIKIAIKNVVKTPKPTSDKDIENRQTHLKMLLLENMKERNKG